ncbi:MAG: hypothetical protein KGJ57_19400 [Sphingomonadales bacterium]|nr:hypothetical protein [Sphingomonadales bacterium]MDE2171562.1 hypothetical protein [Sphingomonadales bacterium]
MQKGFKVDNFYAARSGAIPLLPWTTIPPPFSIDEATSPDEAECKDALKEADTWNPRLTENGMAFTPDLPHVVPTGRCRKCRRG